MSATVLPQDGLLRNRLSLLAAGLFYMYQTLSRGLKLVRSVNATPADSDLILIAGVTFATALTILLAIRSPSSVDRAVFRPAALGSALSLIVLLLSPDATLSVALNWLVSLSWGIAALTSLLFLARSWPNSARSEGP